MYPCIGYIDGGCSALLQEGDQSRSKSENLILRAQIAWLQKQLFGGGKSEKLEDAQLLLKLGQTWRRRRPGCRVAVTSHERTAPKERPTPAETFAHLPVVETIEIIPDEVKANPEAYERIGEERTFEVDITLPQLFKREFVRPKYRLKALLRSLRRRPGGPSWAGMPRRDSWPGWPCPSTSTTCRCTAWNRCPRAGAPGSAARRCATGSRWPRTGSSRFTDGCSSACGRAATLQADETPVRCHDPDEKRGQTTQGWLWVISRPGGDVVFDWRLSRRHDRLNTLLADYKGYILQSDAYQAYPNYAENPEGVIWVGCWAHARRKFNEAQPEAPKATRVVLKLIARMYRLERQWDQAGLRIPGCDPGCRTNFARTLKWLNSDRGCRGEQEARPQSLPGKACDYLLSYWDHSRPIFAMGRPASTITSSKTPSDLPLSVRKTGSLSAIPTPANARRSSTRSSYPVSVMAKTPPLPARRPHSAASPDQPLRSGCSDASPWQPASPRSSRYAHACRDELTHPTRHEQRVTRGYSVGRLRLGEAAFRCSACF